MELNKLKFCGTLNNTVPNCVIAEICQAYSIKLESQRINDPIYRDRVISYLNNFKYEKLISMEMPPETNKKEITLIATFINSSVTWSYKTLKRAFDFWSKGEFHKNFITLNFGLPTPAYPESINLVSCYHICRNLTLTFGTTESELIYYTKIMQNPIYLKNWVCTQLNISKIIPIFDNIKNYNNHLPDIFLTKEDFNLCRSLNSRICKGITPNTDKLAIALSAIYFDIDISMTHSPISEFILLSNDATNYVPIDPTIGNIYIKNKLAFKFSENFNPNFSQEFYNPTIIQKLLKFEGYSDETPWETLGVNSLTPTFYSGYRLQIINTQTIATLESLDNISNSDIICYGIPHTGLVAFTVAELIASFDSNVAFVLPNNDLATPISVNKLFNIAKHLSLTSLVDTIKVVRSYETTKARPITKLMALYKNASEDDKKIIIKNATALLHLGFRMRGWLRGDFPTVTCLVTEQDQTEVDLEISKAITHFEKLTNESGQYGDAIKKFPLLKYFKNFIFSSTKTDGYTVMERIEIIKRGDTTENMSSCVRISSNWICATAAKIFEVLKLPQPFDIRSLRSIS